MNIIEQLEKQKGISQLTAMQLYKCAGNQAIALTPELETDFIRLRRWVEKNEPTDSEFEPRYQALIQKTQSERIRLNYETLKPVSYTHLTLPTICSV